MLTTTTGTTFNIFFPRVAGRAHAPLAHDHRGAAARGTETVLLVEDEPAVRALGARVLRSRGYTVLDAANGVEALRVAAAAGARIDLLLTDVVMPQMGGEALAEQFRALYPRTRVLFVRDCGALFIEKPFSPAALARKVREVLDDRDCHGLQEEGVKPRRFSPGI